MENDMKELYLKVLNSEISLEEFENIIKSIKAKAWSDGYFEGEADAEQECN
jgi:hypothetical protein